MGRIFCIFKTKMKLILIATLVLTISVINGQQLTEKQCRGVYFSEKYYDIEILKEGLNKIHQMILNRNDNTLYFIFEQTFGISTTAAGYININTKEVGVFNEIVNATSIAIDNEYNKVYIGGKEGIFRINNAKNPQRLHVDDEIQSMFFKDVLFYTNQRNEAYVYDNGRIHPVFELQYAHPQKLILDDDHNILFTEDKNLFRVRLGTRAINIHERYRTNVLATDGDYKPYIATDNGIYTYNKYKYVFDKVSDIIGIRGLTFDKEGDPIYAFLDFIVKLKQNPVRCFEPMI